MNKEMFKNRIVLNEHIEQFVFKDYRNPSLNVNITLLHFDGKAMLIDTGYRFQAEIVASFLEDRKIEVTEVLLTHYHPDHSAGISVFQPQKIYCSEHYHENFKRCSEEWDTETHYMRPTHTLKDQEVLFFGPHRLKVINSGSHSEDSIMIEINNRYLVVGDLIMRDVHHKTTYPYISIDGDISGYLYSLKLLKEINNPVLLLAHGIPIEEEPQIKEVINDHLTYFKGLEAYKENTENEIPKFNWSFERWHNSNLRFIS